MTSVAARYGYAGASVARVVERAGVSRSTFYEHFANREDCFAAAHDAALSRIGAALSDGAEEALPQGPRHLLPLLDRILTELAGAPEAARLLLVEAEAARPVRVRHERLRARVEDALGDYLDRCRDGDTRIQIPATALVGGIVGTASMRIFSGQVESLPTLGRELKTLLRFYEAQPGAPVPAQNHWEQMGLGLIPPPTEPPAHRTPPLLPRGLGALAPAEVAVARRERIVAATAAGVAERGFDAITVADIVAAARINRGTFYSCFRGKEDALLAAQMTALQGSIAAAASEFFAVAEWPERVWRAGRALLTYVSANPDLARLGFVEAAAAGEEAIRRQQDGRSAFTIFLEEGYAAAGPDAPPRVASDAIAWGIFGLIRREVVAGRTAEIVSALPAAAYTILAPFIGCAPALEFVEERSGLGPPAARAAP
jgi:AcrR family transcriptional regulator